MTNLFETIRLTVEDDRTLYHIKLIYFKQLNRIKVIICPRFPSLVPGRNKSVAAAALETGIYLNEPRQTRPLSRRPKPPQAAVEHSKPQAAEKIVSHAIKNLSRKPP